MMKVAILGANGRSGSLCVKACLEQGFEVNAGVHRSNNLPANPNLTVLEVDGTNPAQVESLVKGCDAVISLIGHVKGSPDWVQSETISNVISAMNQHGVKKLISLTGTGARLPGDKPSLIDKFLNLGVMIVDPKRIRDGVKHVALIKRSNVNWTIVRVLKLTNNEATPYRLTSGGPAQILTSRDTVARAIMEILNTDSYQNSAPVISKI